MQTVSLQRSKTPTLNECSGYDPKLSDGVDSVWEFWEMWSTFSLPYSQVHSDPEWWFLSMGPIYGSKRTVLPFNCM